MLWLRRGWLCAMACTMVLTGASALLMRYELWTPEPTLTPELYSSAFSFHGLMAMALLVGALLAIPALQPTAGRGSVALGSIALAVWAAAVALLAIAPSSTGVRMLAASLGFGAVQLGISLRSPRPFAAMAALVAIAIVAIPLFGGALPTAPLWLAATTAAAVRVFPGATQRSPFALFTIAPCLVLAWVATALVHVVHTGYFHDTTAMVSPLPLTGGALLGALLVAATPQAATPSRLAQVAAMLIAAGSIATSLGFVVLGLQGMPRRYFAYDAEFRTLHVLVGVAAVVTALGCVAAVFALARHAHEDVHRLRRQR